MIEGLKADGHCVFIGQFARHLPIAILMEIVGPPASDRPLLTRIAEAAMRGETEAQRKEAAGKLMAYGMGKVAERRADPDNDLISLVVKTEVEGKPIDDITLTGLILLLLLGGLDEHKFTDPLTVDFDRVRPGANATFGGRRAPLRRFDAGAYRTAGVPGEWLKRIHDFAIKPGTQPKSQRAHRRDDHQARTGVVGAMSAPGTRRFICFHCGLVYDEVLGCPEDGIAPGTLWEDVPDNWVCPKCGADKSDFRLDGDF